MQFEGEWKSAASKRKIFHNEQSYSQADSTYSNSLAHPTPTPNISKSMQHIKGGEAAMMVELKKANA